MDLWLTILLIAVAVVGAAALTYLLATNRAARTVAGAVLVAARQVVGGYLRTHPPDATALHGLILSGYMALPESVRGRITLEAFEALVLPLLRQAEDALRTPPPADTRALGPGGPFDA